MKKDIKEETIKIRLTKREKDIIRGEADRLGIAMSELIRYGTLNYIDIWRGKQ